MKYNTVLSALIIFLTLSLLCASASAATQTYALGDKVVITGTATGNPQQGLAFWVFGPNYWTRETKQVSGTSYSYEISSSTTQNLAPGQYFCVVQHPMYNGKFDVYVSGDKVVSTAGESFVISGSGKLQGTAAAYALENLLDSPSIDDTYTTTSFVLEVPWISFKPSSTYYIGDKIMISGTTNLNYGDKLLYEVSPSKFEPTSKNAGRSDLSKGATGTITVEYGYPSNTWEFLLDTSQMTPDLYTVTVSKEDGSSPFSQTFTLVEGRPEVITTHPTASQTISTPISTQSVPVTSVNPNPTTAGMGSIFVFLAVILGSLLYAVTYKRD